MRMAAENTPDASENLETLKLRYQQVLAERDRLRSARAGVTSRLGPLPASAAIVIGLAGGVAHGVDPGYLIAAAILLFVLIVFRTVYRACHRTEFCSRKSLVSRRISPSDSSGRRSIAHVRNSGSKNGYAKRGESMVSFERSRVSL
jgi:hypothetical protein